MPPRHLRADIAADALAAHKMALVSGPRQVGKTTLGLDLLEGRQNYASWDDPAFRRAWVRDPVAALAERGPGPALCRFAQSLRPAWAVHLVEVPEFDRVYAEPGVRVLAYERFLAGLV